MVSVESAGNLTTMRARSGRAESWLRAKQGIVASSTNGRGVNRSMDLSSDRQGLKRRALSRTIIGERRNSSCRSGIMLAQLNLPEGNNLLIYGAAAGGGFIVLILLLVLVFRRK